MQSCAEIKKRGSLYLLLIPQLEALALPIEVERTTKKPTRICLIRPLHNGNVVIYISLTGIYRYLILDFDLNLLDSEMSSTKRQVNAILMSARGALQALRNRKDTNKSRYTTKKAEKMRKNRPGFTASGPNGTSRWPRQHLAPGRATGRSRSRAVRRWCRRASFAA